jgi:class III cytochrome C family protein
MNWLAQLRRSLWLRRLLGALGLSAALLLCPLPAAGGAAWDSGMGLGYAALLFAAVLYLYPLRGDGLPHRRLFTLSQHRRMGWLALAFGALHVALLLIAQPLTSRYLLPSAPLYMLSGLAALIALAILVASGLSARSSLRKTSAAGNVRPPSTSVSLHSLLAALLLTLIAAHIIGSHQLIDSRVKALTLCVLLATPLLWATFRTTRHRIRATTRLLTTVIPCFAASLTLLLLPLPTASSRLLEPVTTPPTLPVYFPHERHTTVNCVTCHHNFIDKTGIGSCLDCHRQRRPDLIRSGEATFHTFCRDCHTGLAQTTIKHGPTRSCAACHVKPTVTSDTRHPSTAYEAVDLTAAVRPARTNR